MNSNKKKMLLVFFLCLLFILFLKHRKQFFLFPLLNIIESPPQDSFEEIYFENEVGGWVYTPLQSPEEEGKHILIYFNGNSGNVSTRINNINVLKQLFPTFTIINFDYPGFGLSSHLPINFSSLLEESLTVVESIIRTYPNKQKLVLWGESLGCLVMAYIFSKTKDSVDVVIQVNGTSSLPETIAFHTPKMLHAFLLPFLPHKMDNSIFYSQCLNKERHKIFIFHAQNDEIVPIGQSQYLYLKLKHQFPSSCYYTPLAGKHNMVLLCKENQKLIANTLEKYF